MTGNAILAFLPILTMFFYFVPVVFVIWFLVKSLKIQQEKNDILRTIADKLNK